MPYFEYMNRITETFSFGIRSKVRSCVHPLIGTVLPRP